MKKVKPQKQSDIDLIPKDKPKNPIRKDGARLCYLCEEVISQERVLSIPDVISCVQCQSKEEGKNPNSIRVKADEGFKGSRPQR